MQIVINICKDDFEEICMQARMVEDTGSLFGRIRKAISHGTPLPKGHGDLIDADELFLDIQTDEQMRLGEHLAWVKERIDNAPTIIEKEDEVES